MIQHLSEYCIQRVSGYDPDAVNRIHLAVYDPNDYGRNDFRSRDESVGPMTMRQMLLKFTNR